MGLYYRVEFLDTTVVIAPSCACSISASYGGALEFSWIDESSMLRKVKKLDTITEDQLRCADIAVLLSRDWKSPHDLRLV